MLKNKVEGKGGKVNLKKKNAFKTKSSKNGTNKELNKRNKYKNLKQKENSDEILFKPPKLAPEPESPKKKMKSNKSDKEEYTPGSLSELIQVKKYGKVIVPWDSSFGKDKNKTAASSTNKKNDSDNLPTLQINPLFDLSKKDGTGGSTKKTGSAETKVFVGNLPEGISKITIQKLFKKCGPTESVKLRVNKKSGNSNAIIQFGNTASCEEALKLNGKVFNGNHLRVNMFKERPISSEESVFVGNLSFSMKDEELWNIFEKCGSIESARIIRDMRTGRGKGYAFVTFESAESAEKALKMSGEIVEGRELRVLKRDTNARSKSDNEVVKRKKIKNPPNPKNKPSVSLLTKKTFTPQHSILSKKQDEIEAMEVDSEEEPVRADEFGTVGKESEDEDHSITSNESDAMGEESEDDNDNDQMISNKSATVEKVSEDEDHPIISNESAKKKNKGTSSLTLTPKTPKHTPGKADWKSKVKKTRHSLASTMFKPVKPSQKRKSC